MSKTSNWKSFATWARSRPAMLRLADRLGRGHGRLRPFEGVRPPAPCPLKPALSHWADQRLAAAWLGHASVLLRIGGMTILTDPVLSHRVGIGLGVVTGGPKRRVAPALTINELPPIDLILLSHAHFDHLDRPTLVRLPKRTPVITAHQTQDLVRDLGFRRVKELRWGESARLGPLDVEAVPVAHWGARTLFDSHRGYNAYAIGAPDGTRVLFGGDSAYHTGFRDVGKVDLAILGIGGYQPYIHSHANPEQAWAMADDVRADVLLPMHHSTFRLSHEPVAEPIERLLTIAGNGADRVVIREVGGSWAA